MSTLLSLVRTGFFHAHGAPSRSAMKTASYGLMHLIVAMTVAFALTGDWRAALAIGLVEPLVQTLAYSLHERAWARREAQGETQRDSGPAPHQGAWAP